MSVAKAADTAAPQNVPTDICAFAIIKTVLTQEEIILAHTGLYCLLLPKKKKTKKNKKNKGHTRSF